MEVRITISGFGESTSVEIDGARSGQPPSTGTTAPSQEATPPADVLRQAAASGAMNAGRAPVFPTGAETGAPAAFIGAATEPEPSASLATDAGTDMPAGAAPGSGAEMEIHTMTEGEAQG